jgi:hypothetical protein
LCGISHLLTESDTASRADSFSANSCIDPENKADGHSASLGAAIKAGAPSRLLDTLEKLYDETHTRTSGIVFALRAIVKVNAPPVDRVIMFDQRPSVFIRVPGISAASMNHRGRSAGLIKALLWGPNPSYTIWLE